MAITYSKQQLIERVKKDVADGFPNSSWPVTDNEILLMLDAVIPMVMKGQIFENAKISGFIEVPEAYLLTYEVTALSQSEVTNEWYATLPQAPLALPSGYQITDAYFSRVGQGRTRSLMFVSPKRISYRANLPSPNGIFARVEGDKIYVQANEGEILYGERLFVQLPISRTADKNAVMNLPDDSIQPIIDAVIGRIRIRYQYPQDVVKDNLPAGNKAS